MHMFWTCSSHLYVLHAVYFSLRQPIYMSMSTTVWLPPASWHCVVVQAQTSTWPNQLLLLVWVNVCATVAFRWRAGRGREYERFETVHCLQPIHFAGMYYRSTLIYPPLVNPPYSLNHQNYKKTNSSPLQNYSLNYRFANCICQDTLNTNPFVHYSLICHFMLTCTKFHFHSTIKANSQQDTFACLDTDSWNGGKPFVY